MKSDLDHHMHDRNHDALLVTGSSVHNPAMYYLTNGAHVGNATLLVKKRDEAPVIIANAMERDEAAKSGLRVIDISKYNLTQLIKEEEGDQLRAAARLYRLIFAELGVRGNVSVFGMREQGAALQLFTAIEEINPHIRIVGEYNNTVLDAVTATKDAAEVKRIRAVGKKTVAVVGGVQEFLTSHRAKNGVLVKKDSTRLTVGEVKHRINFLLMEQGIVDAEGVIFAIGRDAGVPHSRGEARAPIALGQTIVFDIFPAEPGGGYFYDFTRTWCLGYAPDHVQKTYDDVLYAFNTVKKALKPDELTSVYQRMTCDIFEKRGHPTVHSNPQTTSGYVHSLAHGLGLHVHEPPFFRDVENHPDRVTPGSVFTFEPGLYYPDHPAGGFGVRLEDTVWLNPTTLKFETLAQYPKDLVLPVKEIKKRK
jgi:Xaa-Pro aminopeptidase